MKKRSKIDWGKVVFWFVLISLLLSIVYAGVNAILAPADRAEVEPYEKVKADYMLMMLQCILGSVGLLLPSFVERQWKFQVPNYMYIMYIVFLYAAIYLGEVRDFFYVFKNFDNVLHIFSGMMLGALGFSLIEYLSKNKRVPVGLTPASIAIFSFCFAVTIGVFWEIYEFVFDGVFGLNMQKFMLEDGTQLIGRAALTDTMHDLMIDCLGAFIVCAIGFIILRVRAMKEPQTPFWRKLKELLADRDEKAARLEEKSLEKEK